jgi:hypothetical protein
MHERSGWMCLLCVKFILNIFFHHTRSRLWEIRRRSECFGTFVIISTKSINWSQMKRLAFFPDFVRTCLLMRWEVELLAHWMVSWQYGEVTWWGVQLNKEAPLSSHLTTFEEWNQIPIMWDNLQGRPLLYQPWMWMKVRKS